MNQIMCTGKITNKKNINHIHTMSNKGLEPLHSVRKTDTLPVKLIADFALHIKHLKKKMFI